MRHKRFFNEDSHKFIEDLVSRLDYDIHRKNAEYLLGLSEKEFTQEFEYALTKSDVNLTLANDPETGEPIDEFATEFIFLNYLFYRIISTDSLLYEYFDHCESINKPISEKFTNWHEQNLFKSSYVYNRLEKLKYSREIEGLKTNIGHLQKPIKKTTKATIEGKPINLLERYYLLNKLFELEKTVNTLDISKGEKDKLLGLILDCNTTNARHLLNGKYDAHLRSQEINNYLATLKK